MTPEQAKNYKQFVYDLRAALKPYDKTHKFQPDTVLGLPVHNIMVHLISHGYVIKIEQTESLRLEEARRSLLQLINNKISMKIDKTKIGE